MAIKKIKIANFKSFKDLEVEFGRFNVLIGGNASGKSNFVQIFKFLRDIIDYDLDNAISMQGGIEYLRNIIIGSSEDFSVEVVVSDQRPILPMKKEKKLIGSKKYEVIYKFSMRFGKEGQEFEILEDKLIRKYDFVRLEMQKGEIEEREKLGRGQIILYNINGKFDIDSNLPEGIEEEDIFPSFLREQELQPGTLLLENPYFLFLIYPWEDIFSNAAIYDFDSKLSKKSVPITGKAELEEDGSNLAIVLKNIIGDEDKKRKFSNLVKDLLPFVEDVDVEKFTDRSLLLKLQEIYTKEQYLPAFLMSDGTINIIALIVALYFEKKPLAIIEEPERNIHPYLISKVVDMMKDASQQKQIIVTTHNPEVVKYAGLDNILLVSRDKEGFSTISRPSEKDEVKTFLENEVGIEELYVQNLLGVWNEL